MPRIFKVLAALITAAGALWGPAAGAAEPVALILDVAGPVQPQVGLYDELPAGSVLELGSAGRVTISHYGSCEEVTLSGGSVSIGGNAIEPRGSRIDARTKVDCPALITASAADLVNMAVTLRSARKVTVASPRPDFVLVGQWGKGFDRLGVFGQDGTNLTLAVDRGRVSWPDNAGALTPGVSYIVLLNGPGARQHAARLEVSADQKGLTVLKEK